MIGIVVVAALDLSPAETGAVLREAKPFSEAPPMTQPDEAPLFTRYTFGELQLSTTVS
jgi:hypothetical protein